MNKLKIYWKSIELHFTRIIYTKPAPCLAQVATHTGVAKSGNRHQKINQSVLEIDDLPWAEAPIAFPLSTGE